MVKVTQSPQGQRPSPRKANRVASAGSPTLIEEAARVFLALGITPMDLRLRATSGSAMVGLADAIDAQARAL